MRKPGSFTARCAGKVAGALTRREVRAARGRGIGVARRPLPRGAREQTRGSRPGGSRAARAWRAKAPGAVVHASEEARRLDIHHVALLFESILSTMTSHWRTTHLLVLSPLKESRALRRSERGWEPGRAG